MQNFTNPSPRAPVGKRDQPASPAGFSPAAIATGFAFGKHGIKRQNMQQSPLARQKPNHDMLKLEVSRQMKTSHINGKSPMMKSQTLIKQKFESENVQQQQVFDRPAGSHSESASACQIKRPALSKMNPQTRPIADDSIPGGGRWTREEDAKLRQGVTAIGATKWKKISEEFLGGKRSDVQCLHRWQKVLRPGLVKGPWTEEEDNMIRSCIERKVTKWSEIAERIPGRIGKQCRERWFNHLDPAIDHSSWSEEEERVLVTAQAKFGNRWCEIAKLLPGRPENAVKNRWNSAIRRKWQLKLGLIVTDNKGKPVDPQPPRLQVTLPLPALVPVVKRKNDGSIGGPQPSGGGPGVLEGSHSHQHYPSMHSQMDPNVRNFGAGVPPPPAVIPAATLAQVKPKKTKANSDNKKVNPPKEKKVRAKNSATRKPKSTKLKDGTTAKRKQPTKAALKKAGAHLAENHAACQSFSGSLDMALIGGMHGAQSPPGQFQWDFQENNGLDFNASDILGLETEMLLGSSYLKTQPSSCKSIGGRGTSTSNFPQLFVNKSGQMNFHDQGTNSSSSSSQNNSQTVHHQQLAHMQQSFQKNNKGLVSPIGPMVVWDNGQPAELDRGMATLTLSMLDNEFDMGLNMPGPRTDDSFGVNWTQQGLFSPNQ